MFKILLKINFFILIFFSTSFAEMIKSIEITGNKRLSEASILLFGKIENNKDYNNQDLNSILKNLYETDFFNQVNLKVENGILKIRLSENPIIEDVQINGLKNETFEKELQKLFKISILNIMNFFVKTWIYDNSTSIRSILEHFQSDEFQFEDQI